MAEVGPMLVDIGRIQTRGRKLPPWTDAKAQTVLIRAKTSSPTMTEDPSTCLITGDIALRNSDIGPTRLCFTEFREFRQNLAKQEDVSRSWPTWADMCSSQRVDAVRVRPYVLASVGRIEASIDQHRSNCEQCTHRTKRHFSWNTFFFQGGFGAPLGAIHVASRGTHLNHAHVGLGRHLTAIALLSKRPSGLNQQR